MLYLCEYAALLAVQSSGQQIQALQKEKGRGGFPKFIFGPERAQTRNHSAEVRDISDADGGCGGCRHHHLHDEGLLPRGQGSQGDH